MIGRYVFRKKFYRFFAGALDIAGYSAGYSFGRSAEKAPARPKNILIVRLDHLGDVLPATGLPKILKKQFPGARITFLVSSLGASLLQNNPYVEEVIVYDAPWFLRTRKKAAHGRTFGTLARELEKRSFDMALAPRGDLRENFLLWKAKIPYRVGYGVTGGGFFLNCELVYRFGVHESERTLDVARNLGIKDPVLVPEVYFFSGEEKELAAKAGAWGIDRQTPWLGLQVDAGARSKEWPEESLLAFLKTFAAKFPEAKLALIGSNNTRASRLEVSLGADFRPDRFLNLAGKTTARELFFLLKYFRGFIGADSGPAHVAAALGVPTLFLYSGTNVFEEWKSLSGNASFLRYPVLCSPCFLTDCKVAGHPCMSRIEVRDVVNWVERERGNWASHGS